MAAVNRRFDDLERLLLLPRASGAFVFDVVPGSNAAEAGFQDGDTIVSVDGSAVSNAETLIAALRPTGGEDRRRVRVVRAGGDQVELSMRAGRPGLWTCAVAAGRPAWRPAPDYAEEPDFSGLLSQPIGWQRIGFPDGLAGYERVRLQRVGGDIALDYLFHMGGDQGGHRWTYRAQLASRHRLDRWLTASTLAFSMDGMGGGGSRSATERLDDGSWRGWKEEAGKARQPTASSPSAQAISVYAVSLLATTMPQRSGAALTFTMLDDIDGRARGRCRMECLGPAEVQVGGRPTPAWTYAWRHYGERDEGERFHVGAERAIVRTEWGPDYNFCWGERVDPAQVAQGLPPHIHVESEA